MSSNTATRRGRDLVEEYIEDHARAEEHELDSISALIRDVLLYVEEEYQPDDVEYVISVASEGL